MLTPWSEPPATRQLGAQRLRVLLAEDTDLVREILAHRLQQAGCDVTQAQDGAEALAVLTGADAAFDCALVDMHMPPGIDGLEVVRKLREHEERHHATLGGPPNHKLSPLPTYLLTAHLDERLSARAEGLAQGVIDKQMHVKALVQLMRSAARD